jgi:ABC-type uncharacterized transport system auxiliary subunit
MKERRQLMRRFVGLIPIAVAALLLEGCGGGRPIQYYTLDLPAAPPPSTSTYPATLLVGRIHAPEILQDEPIVYRSGPNEIGTYEYHYWDEPPVRMVRVMLIRTLRASGKYQSVAQLGSLAEGEFVLEGRLDDFEEVDRGAAIAALVTMEFELVDRKAHRTVWTHSYSRSDPVQGRQIAGVVAALNHNLMQGLNEVESSLDAYFSANPPGKS